MIAEFAAQIIVETALRQTREELARQSAKEALKNGGRVLIYDARA
jgi:hypothetical protein